MIRPITLICWVLALSAGLYLYRAKHEVELMDKHIDEIARETADLRVESRRLLDDWIRLGEPEQLRKYSDQYLGLKPVAPTQFVRVTDLPDRLPPPRPDPVGEPQQPVEQSPLVQLPPLRLPAVRPDGGAATAQASPGSAETDDVEAEDFPVPPVPPPASPRPASAATPPAFVGSTPAASVPLQARPVSLRPPAVPQEPEPVRPHPAGETPPWEEPHAAPARPAEPKPAPVRVSEPRPAVPAASSAQLPATSSAQIPATSSAQIPATSSGQMKAQELPPLQAQVPVQKTVQAPKAPQPRAAENVVNNRSREVFPAPAPVQQPRIPVQQGSLLGMSRGVQPPLPAPTQVNATWSNSGGR
jgi:hypothetical protein